MHIAFLHTSEIHVNRFENLLSSINPKIKAKHYVNETLLQDALAGEANKALFYSEIKHIQNENPALIICTCSSYSHLCDAKEKVYNIDKPVAKHLVNNYKKILVVYAAESTKTITEDILKQMANELNKQIELVLCNCTSTWTYFERGEHELYKKTIAENIISYKNQTDVIFLAQESMDGTQQYLKHSLIEIYTSPEIGLKSILHNIK